MDQRRAMRVMAALLGLLGCAAPAQPGSAGASERVQRGSLDSAEFPTGSGSGGISSSVQPPHTDSAQQPGAAGDQHHRLPADGYDSDSDGVPDARDRCPDTPGIDLPDSMRAGCPPRPRPTVLPPAEIEFRGRIQFDSGTSTLPPAATSVLDELARALGSHGEIALEIIGHTDSSEPEDLALMRARRVLDALVARGVAPSRVELSGQGARSPTATNATAQGRAQNRRVEFLRRGPRTPLGR
jgi:outer membrane protein OmpA-like peptidoglycan-associated protein